VKGSLTHSQGKGSIRHNHDKNYRASRDNVDSARIDENVVLKNENLKEVYQKLFGEAVVEYNTKQKRNDRKIDNYFEKLFGVRATKSNCENVVQEQKTKNPRKSFYEDLVQIGDKDSFACGTFEGNKAKECLDIYMRGFQERNPNFYVFSAVIHMDEATPHLHLDYVPFSEKYKHGMKKQNSISKALGDMGFGTDKGAIDRWRQRERKVLEEICKENGIEITAPKSEKRDRLTVGEYKAIKEKAKSKAVKDLEEEKNHLEGNLELLRGEQTEIETNVQNLDVEYKTKSKAVKDLDHTLIDRNREVADLDRIIKNKNENLQELQQMKVRADEISTDNHKVDKAMFGDKETVKVPKDDYDKMMRQSKAYRVNRPKIKKLEERTEAVTERERSVNIAIKKHHEKVTAFNNDMKPIREHYNTGGDALGFIRQLQDENSRLKTLTDSLREKVATLEKKLVQAKEKAQNVIAALSWVVGDVFARFSFDNNYKKAVDRYIFIDCNIKTEDGRNPNLAPELNETITKNLTALTRRKSVER